MCNVFLDSIEELFKEKKARNSFIVVNNPNHSEKALRHIVKDLKRQRKKRQ